MFEFKASHENNSVLIMRCDFINELLYTKNVFSKISIADYYYMLPEKIFTVYDSLIATRLSPFAEKLEEYSLRIFESGIKQHWKVLLHAISDGIDLNQILIIKEEYMLKFSDLKHVFLICAIGWAASFAVFIGEILIHKPSRKLYARKIFDKITFKSRRDKNKREKEMKMRERFRQVIEEETFEMIQCEV